MEDFMVFNKHFGLLVVINVWIQKKIIDADS